MFIIILCFDKANMPIENSAIMARIASSSKNTTSQSTYTERLTTLVNKFHVSIYDIVKQPEHYIPKLIKLYPNPTTLKNYITTILVVFKSIPQLTAKKQRAFSLWRAEHDRLRHIEREKQVSDAAPSVTLADLQRKYTELSKSNIKPQYLLLLASILNLRTVFNLNQVAIVRAPAKTAPSKDYIYITDMTGFAKINNKKLRLSPDYVKLLHNELFLFDFNKQDSYNAFVRRAFKHMFPGSNLGSHMINQVLEHSRDIRQ